MVFVTGATGLVGSHLVQALVQQGRQVRALYRSAIPSYEGADKVEWIKGDILDVIALEEALAGVEQVYHCAAVVSFNPKKIHELYQTNIEGTANIVNACITAGVQKLLHVSSVAALGRINEGVAIDENMHWSPKTNNSEYGKSKYLAEMEVWRGIGEGLKAVIVNPTIILGAGDWNGGSSQIFKTVYEEFPWYTDGITGFVDVVDVVSAMQLLMESEVSAQRYILNAVNMSFKELFVMIAQCFGKRPVHKKVTPFMAGVIWRWEAIKYRLTGISPLLTKETAASAQAKVFFKNGKFLQQFPSFKYTPITTTIYNICNQLKMKHQLI
ncbi:NAD-dependent epimerase/dehydratase family protein [Ilyomonas limi]|uniref:NAD-dependent epimerase/dehydratase family protein n=1 Tax=Ilyomonas limi TaxID=2575867 RepID=A0A4U3L457_9BACT|nr:NAD-dependent epimerase/dehydratase family protein [Ilyomonas limi]TKK68327.1 NAD-dependent epimerase/dehydratase family protein [Ilyomonas limi]